jgi:hypothetical protein
MTDEGRGLPRVVTLAEDEGGNNREGVGIGVGVGAGKIMKAKGDRKPGRMLGLQIAEG